MLIIQISEKHKHGGPDPEINTGVSYKIIIVKMSVCVQIVRQHGRFVRNYGVRQPDLPCCGTNTHDSIPKLAQSQKSSDSNGSNREMITARKIKNAGLCAIRA